MTKGTMAMSEHGYYEQILAIDKGEIGRPFESYGYIHIVEVLDREDAGIVPLEEARALIQELLKRQKHDKLAIDLSKKLLKDADVTIYSRTLKKLPQVSPE